MVHRPWLTAARPLVSLGQLPEAGIRVEQLHAAVADACALARRRSLVYDYRGEPSYRDMCTLGSLDLDALSDEFGCVYERIRALLAERIRRPVHAVPDENERYVVNVLDRPFDQQGWHVDTYAYAVNACFEASLGGGELELAVAGRALRFHFPADAWYALRTDAVPHRVTPLLTGRRVVLNLAFHSDAEAPRASYSSSTLYERTASSR
jgi:hypothetical protein